MSGSLNQKLLDTNVLNIGSSKNNSNRIKVLESSNLKNIIINGAMDIWQRGSLFTSIASGYTADRFSFNKNTTAAITITKSTNIPNNNFNYSLLLSNTTADTTTLSNKYCRLQYKVEGYDFKNLVGKTCLLSFWIKSNKEGNYCISFQNSATNRSYIVDYTINNANIWEYKTIPINFYSDGTWEKTNLTGLIINFTLSAGIQYRMSSNAWINSNYLASPTISDFVDTINSNLYITGVQLTESSLELPFLYRSIAEEIELCQRYFEKSYNIDINPGVATWDGTSAMTTSKAQTSYDGLQRIFKTRKRNSPTMEWYAPNSGNYPDVSYYSGGWNDGSVSSTSRENENSTGYPNGGNISDQSEIEVHWTADSEL